MKFSLLTLSQLTFSALAWENSFSTKFAVQEGHQIDIMIQKNDVLECLIKPPGMNFFLTPRYGDDCQTLPDYGCPEEPNCDLR